MALYCRMDIRKIVGRNLYKARINKGLSRKELAEKSGISAKYIQLVESQTDSNISILTLESLARALRIKTYLLLKF